ncbi:hypothetical protein PL11_001760 [Lentilactobacillus curieae]|uniref:Uncharacterized protein n=1 Tax=Lentilactobacillus curieae TaxID=1138822 RepID=A0A1S6QGK5_9LACO|nr:hypothetical protein [Lentilactobacillus curieae]AQW20730.1 hypothetical protein PL11_001760 [Lentilactobacillus curieae]
MANLKESALNRISGKTGETVPDADIVKSLEDYGLTDFYVVYWRGGPVAGVGKSFIKDSAIRPVMGIQHEIWHYQLKNLTGDRKVDSKNLEANYTVTKKKLRVPRVGVTPQQWGRIFGNIWYPK